MSIFRDLVVGLDPAAPGGSLSVTTRVVIGDDGTFQTAKGEIMSDGEKALTVEELAAIKNTVAHYSGALANIYMYEVVQRLIAAAERSCKRPIADAPKDGTKILVCDADTGWHQARYFHGTKRFYDTNGPVMWKPVSWLPIPGEGGCDATRTNKAIGKKDR